MNQINVADHTLFATELFDTAQTPTAQSPISRKINAVAEACLER
jgi:hypothetical protein